MGAPNPNTLTQKELARLLSCRDRDAYERADVEGYPYSLRHGVDNEGNAITHRVYYRDVVQAFRDEVGRLGARRKAS